MNGRLTALEVGNFRSLREVVLPLGPLTVLVGPNGAGKTNVLRALHFLASAASLGVEPTLAAWGGFDYVTFRGGERPVTSMRFAVRATWTRHSTDTAPDEYELTLRRRKKSLSVGETFQVTLRPGAGRRNVFHCLPRLRTEDGGREGTVVADRLASFRLFDVDVRAARRPSRLDHGGRAALDDRAANLAAFLCALRAGHDQEWEWLVDDAREILPSLADIDVEHPRDAGDGEVRIVLRERGLRSPTSLAAASDATVRLFALLAVLYDPAPPALAGIDGVERGLHPQALELVAERLRQACATRQLLVTTHSPALVDRLTPDELVVCERGEDGASVLPAHDRDHVEAVVTASEGLPLGQLWFSGALGGDL